MPNLISPYTAVGDAAGNLYVADAYNNAIRKITPNGTVTTFAGSLTGVPGFVDATGTAALFNNPQGIAMDASGNLFVSDYGNNAIRKITSAGAVSTFYQAPGAFGPTGVCFDNSGNLIVAAQLSFPDMLNKSGRYAYRNCGQHFGLCRIY